MLYQKSMNLYKNFLFFKILLPSTLMQGIVHLWSIQSEVVNSQIDPKSMHDKFSWIYPSNFWCWVDKTENSSF